MRKIDRIIEYRKNKQIIRDGNMYIPIEYQKKCIICGKIFSIEYQNANVLYCSNECRKISLSKRREKLKLIVKTKDEICRDIYNRYKNSAKKRKLSFDLIISDFIEHYQNKCFYCGDTIKHTAFDRIDSNIGYNKNNIVPCCSKCNTMKNNMSVNDFYKHITKIFNKRCR